MENVGTRGTRILLKGDLQLNLNTSATPMSAIFDDPQF